MVANYHRRIFSEAPKGRGMEEGKAATGDGRLHL